MREHEAIGAGRGRSSPDSLVAGAMDQILWRVNRLRCMTPAEIGHRAMRALAIQAEYWGLRSYEAPSPDFTRATYPWIHVSAEVEAAPCLAAARNAAAGRFDVFSMEGADLGSPPRWNRDPKTGIEVPLTFGKLLDYRDPGLVGDVRYLWELNRHTHLITLAQAFVLSGDARYLEVIRRHLDNWFASCPCPMGPNWSSTLEPALRLINWSVTWQLLGGSSSPLFENAEGARFRKRWLDSVFQHAQFVRGHFSLYSSANNHLIGEAAGLFVAAVTWPHWPHARKWLAYSKEILESEALLQNAPDGVNREQSVSYQQFELELLLIALLAGKANGNAFSAAYESRIEAMMEYLASIMDAGGNIPLFGDSDDSHVLKLAQGGEHCRFRSLLAAGALLFHRGDFKVKARALDDKTRWLFGKEADSAFEQLECGGAKLPVRRTFPDGGYYILGCDFETGNEIRLIADAGPLGYQAIAAHGHADALAFTLSVGGEYFFIDAGTYTYFPAGPWRRYFRGTAAHNTVRVDGQDQSRSGGNFMWLRKAHADCSYWRSTAESDIFEGWHDGYARLPDPVTHRRHITLDKRTRRIVIEDILQMSGVHEIELFFHCNEQCQLEPVEYGYQLSLAGRALTLKLPHAEQAVTRVHNGSTNPVLGWASRRFDEKRPAPTIEWRARLTGDMTLRSEIRC